MLFLFTDSPQKLNVEKFRATLIIFIYLTSSSAQLQRPFFFYLKIVKNDHSSASDWWECSKSSFKENAKIFSKHSTTPENVTISRQNLLFLLKTLKNNHSSASDWCGSIKTSFKENARTFSKNYTTQKNIETLRLKEDCKTYIKKKTSNQN